ncbi:hypothetical protein GGR52DRAFT_426949 [Hypoxylon sp. FL1284]|nr:hypothetical protein GGR52DRAFT_426949 [Hypoxylon sp. FL1284]
MSTLGPYFGGLSAINNWNGGKLRLARSKSASDALDRDALPLGDRIPWNIDDSDVSIRGRGLRVYIGLFGFTRNAGWYDYPPTSQSVHVDARKLPRFQIDVFTCAVSAHPRSEDISKCGDDTPIANLYSHIYQAIFARSCHVDFKFRASSFSKEETLTARVLHCGNCQYHIANRLVNSGKTWLAVQGNSKRKFSFFFTALPLFLSRSAMNNIYLTCVAFWLPRCIADHRFDRSARKYTAHYPRVQPATIKRRHRLTCRVCCRQISHFGENLGR